MKVMLSEADASLESSVRWASWAMVLCGLATAAALLFTDLKAAYGRYSDQIPFPFFRSVVLPGRVAWVVQELPALLIPLYFLTQAQGPAAFVLALFVLHYVHRSLIFPFLIRGPRPTPLQTFLMAFAFCTWNGWMQGAYHARLAVYPPDYLWTPRALLGTLLFFAGMAVNVHSDHILRSLRSSCETNSYAIPYGGLFSLVSGANFLGETVEWVGYALLAGSLPAAAFAFFTAANIGPRARQHHLWYQRKFPEYPKERRALIPFLW